MILYNNYLYINIESKRPLYIRDVFDPQYNNHLYINIESKRSLYFGTCVILNIRTVRTLILNTCLLYTSDAADE